MSKIKNFWPYLLILLTTLILFSPIFLGKVPFPGDLLANENPYKTYSFLGYQSGGYPNKAQGPDVIKEIYPWKHFSISELKKGEFPFWNPYNFSGNPQMADFQTAVFYPLNLFYFVFPFNQAWTLMIFLQPFLAGIFMYLFLRKAVKLGEVASAFGAIAFSFSSYMTVWIEYGNIGHTYLWLPLILLFAKKLSEKISSLNFAILTGSYVFCFLGGYIQGFFYISIISLLYFIYNIIKLPKNGQKVKKIILFLFSNVLCLSIVSFQLLSTYQLFLGSTRGSYSLSQITNLLLKPYYLVVIFFPDFFGNPATRNYWINGTYIEKVMYFGTSTILFLVYAIKKVKTSDKNFFLILSILSLVIVVNLPFINLFYLIPIPVISTTVPTRELSLFIFSSLVLGAIGLNEWLKNKDSKKNIILIYFTVYLVLFLLALVLSYLGLISKQNFAISLRNMIFPMMLALLTVIVLVLRNKLKILSIIFLFMLLVLDLGYFFNKITPFSPEQLIYPNVPIVSFLKENSGIDRFWGYGNAYIPANFQSVDGIYSPEGNDPLHINRYGELLASSGDGNLPKVFSRTDANIAFGFGKEDLRNNLYRKRILNLLGVKYVLNRQDSNPFPETFPTNELRLVWQNFPWQVYENKNVLPRYFLTGEYIVKETKLDILSSIYNPNLDLRKTLILEEKPSIPINKLSSGTVSLVSYAPNKIVLRTNTNGNLLLFLSDNYFPDWKTTVDGKKWSIQRADYTFRAVPVPKGNHIITMTYNSEFFTLGLKIAGIGVLIFIFSLLTLKIYEKKT